MTLALTKRLSLRYIAVLVVLAGLAVASQIVMMWSINENLNDASFVNISGRQRMQSHQVALYAENYAESKDHVKAQKTREMLRESISKLKRSYDLLLRSYEDANSKNIMSAELKSLFYGPKKFLDQEVKIFLEHARSLASTPKWDVNSDNQDLIYLLDTAPGPLLEALEMVVSQYQKEGEQHVLFLKRMQTLFFVLALLVLLLSAVSVFRPMTRRIELELDARQKAENEERSAKEVAVSANQVKTDFLANVSHELRTPLNGIIGFSQMLMDETFGTMGNAKNKEYVNDIHHAGQYLLEVVNDLLDVSEVESGAMNLMESNVDFGLLIKSGVEFYGDNAAKLNVTLSMEVAENLPPFFADAAKVKQIVHNLLSNALKFTHAGGTVSISAKMNGDGDMIMEITDTGIGIKSEDISKVMKPFMQVENILTRTHVGSGLGLSLSKRFTELHGGTLNIKSEINIGTTVTVCFPKERIIQNDYSV